MNLKELAARQLSIYDSKNADYGNSFHTTVEKLTLIAALVRITDKMERIRRLQEHSAQVTDEKLKDTISDALNYLIMFSAEIILYTHELSEEHRVEGQPDNVTLVHILLDSLANDEPLVDEANPQRILEIWDDLCDATMVALQLHSEEKLDEVLSVNTILVDMVAFYLLQLSY